MNLEIYKPESQDTKQSKLILCNSIESLSANNPFVITSYFSKETIEKIDSIDFTNIVNNYSYDLGFEVFLKNEFSRNDSQTFLDITNETIDDFTFCYNIPNTISHY